MRDTFQPAFPPLCRSFSWTSSSAKPSSISTPASPLEIPPTRPVQNTPEVIAPAASASSVAQGVIPEATSATIPMTPANVTQDIAVAPGIVEPLNGIGAIPESTTLQALEPGSIAGLGLSSGFPSGWITHMIDYLHLSLGYGWPATILLVQLALRIPLGFLQLSTLRSTARMQSHWKQISALQAQADAAKKSGNKLLYNASLLRVQTVTEKSGFGVLGLPKIIGTQLLTLTAQAGTFLAIRRLANLPLDDMMATSWAWLPSLTAPDPYYILPAANLLVVQATLWVGSLRLVRPEEHSLTQPYSCSSSTPSIYLVPTC
jgi:YidC/Oxa1 family membrane protein insertase